ncbi:MAG: prephenate dehydratase [Bacteriovoracaceae bacterium]|nr:prephenate dehydratase [Bacteriovoracaceae bacterium]
MKVAIQGVKASFHDVAARKFWGDQITDSSLEECPSFPKLFLALDSKNVDFAVMAIENALAGSILPNYALMEKYRVKIVGEVYLKIEMCLMSLPEDNFDDIKVVQSHPMAIIQCQEFLNQYPHLKIVEHADTAESAKEIQEKKMRGVASIASRLAAQEYDLRILNEGIETNSLNFTRFLILSREEDYVANIHANKSTLRFEAEHKPGSLARVLNIIQSYQVNLTKIQSTPVIGRPYFYGFHVDLEWEYKKNYHLMLQELKEKTQNLIHFGDYIAGKRVKL